MIIEEYRSYYEMMLSLSEKYIQVQGHFRGSVEKAMNKQIDYKFLIDYRFFALSKATKTFKAFYHLLELGFYEDAMILSRTMYECYLSNHFFEDQFDLNLQNDMIVIPVGLMNGTYSLNDGVVKRKDTGEVVEYNMHDPKSLILGKDKRIFYPLYNFLCTMAHCNFSQCTNYLDYDGKFILDNEDCGPIAHLVGLYVFSKIFESTILMEGMPFNSPDDAKIYEDFLVDLTIFLYSKMDDVKQFSLPYTISDSILKDILKNMKNSFKEQLGRVDKSFVTLLENQKKETNQERILKSTLLDNEYPSAYFEKLKRKNGGLSQYPELQHLSPECWQHTLDVIDRAAKYRDKVSDPYAFMLLALTCDFGDLCKGAEEDPAIEKLTIIEKFLNRVSNKFFSKRYVLKKASQHAAFAEGLFSENPEELIAALQL